MTSNDKPEQLDAAAVLEDPAPDPDPAPETEPDPAPETVPVGTSVPVYDCLVQRSDGTVIGRASGGFVVTEPGTYRFHGEGVPVLTITATDDTPED